MDRYYLEFRVKIANLGVPDQQGERLSDDLVFFTEAVIPVTLDFKDNEVYGYAESIERIGDALWATIKLDKGLLNSTMANALSNLKPCIGGSTLVRTDSEVKKVRIRQIALCTQNVDDKIKSLKDQVNGK